MIHTKTLLTALTLTAFVGAHDSQALTITYAGTQANIDTKADDGTTSGWHSTGNAKPLDIDGDNALGTDGWAFSKNGTSGNNDPYRSLPSYFTDTNGVGWDVLAGNSTQSTTYGLMDGPTNLAPGVNPATEVGFGTWWVFNGGPTNGVAQNIIQFTFNGDASSLAGKTLRVGILFDGVPSNNDSRRLGTQAMAINQTAGGSATATSGDLDVDDDGLDVAFFDLTNISEGDTFVINVDPSNTTYAHVNGVTFDVGVPEPGSLALMGLGGLLIARRRRG